MKELIGILFLITNFTFAQNAEIVERLAYCDSLEKVGLTLEKPALVAESYYIRGKIASEQFDINKSNNWFFKALEVSKKLPVNNLQGKIYGYLATNATFTGSFGDFEYFLNKAKEVYTKTNSKDGLRDVRGKQLALYTGQFNKKTDHKKAIELLLKELPAKDPVSYNDSMHIAAVNFQLGWNKLQIADKSSLKNLMISSEIWEKLKSNQLLGSLLTEADALLKFKEFDALEAKITEIKIIKESKEFDKETVLHFYQTMASYDMYRNDRLAWLENSLNAKTIESEKNKNAVANFSEFHQDKTLISTQETSLKANIFALTVGALTIVLLSVLAYRYFKKFRISVKEEGKNKLLIEEVNHRVKNNFQTLSNLIMLQDMELADSESKKALEETQMRINTLANVHSNLYGKDSLEKVNMEDFLYEHVTALLEAFDLQKVDFKLKVDAPALNSEKAIIIALIVNEWVTNVCKYAYINHPEPKLEVSLNAKNSLWTLRIDDFGNKKIEIVKTSSFGLNLISKLLEQLNGTKKYNEYQNLSEISFSNYSNN